MSIEKFEGDFRKEESGVLVLPISTIQSIRNADVLGYWVYLASKPNTWSPNLKELMVHFGHGQHKTRAVLNTLVEHGLMSVTQTKRKGKFHRNQYLLHLRPKIEPRYTSCNTVTVLRKQEHIDIIDIDNRDLDQTSSSTGVERHSENSEKPSKPNSPNNGTVKMFAAFWAMYPNKQAKKRTLAIWKREKLDKIADMIIDKLTVQIRTTWRNKERQYIPLPSTYLNHERYNDEVETTTETTRPATREEESHLLTPEQRKQWQLYDSSKGGKGLRPVAWRTANA